MKYEIKDFVGVFTEVYPEKYCAHLISEFERLVGGGAGYDRQKGEGALKDAKDDMQLNLNIKAHNAQAFNNQDVVDMFFKGLQHCYEQYTTTYSVLKQGRIRSSHMKMQRTAPGGGYHIWHSEQGNDVNAERVLTYILYLNTLQPEEAGETEFLYQQKRVRPVENTMLVWPAAYTHAHRGNVVHGENAKYIVTGWFYYD